MLYEGKTKKERKEHVRQVMGTVVKKIAYILYSKKITEKYYQKPSILKESVL